MENNRSLQILLNANIPIFYGLSTSELREFISHCNMQQAKQGDVIIPYGVYNSKTFIVLGGVYEVLTMVDQGLRRFTKIIKGDCMGAQSLVLDEAYPAEIRCIKDGVLLIFDRSDLVKIPGFDLKIYRNLSRIMSKKMLMFSEMVPGFLEKNASRKMNTQFGIKLFRYKFVGYALPK